MSPRDHRIDVLRGVAIFLVLLHHFHLAYNLGPGLLYRNGNYGVVIFFVISGYLITFTSLRRFGSLRRISLRPFYAFRFARIYPCLVLVLVLITLPGVAGIRYFASNKPVSFWLADLSVLTLWHNILMAHFGYFNYGLNILWSLSVEEVFYLLFPLLCVTLRSKWLIIFVWFAAIVYAPIYRSQHSNDDIQYLYADFSCFDAIAMGCCVALLARYRRVQGAVRNVLQPIAALSISAVFFYRSIGANVIWGPTLMALSVAIFLWTEAGQESSQTSSLEPLGWLGRHSYELYLFHIVILAALRNVFDRKELPMSYKWPWFCLFLAISATAAWAIARWYSEPLNQLIRKRLA